MLFKCVERNLAACGQYMFYVCWVAEWNSFVRACKALIIFMHVSVHAWALHVCRWLVSPLHFSPSSMFPHKYDRGDRRRGDVEHRAWGGICIISKMWQLTGNGIFSSGRDDLQAFRRVSFSIVLLASFGGQRSEVLCTSTLGRWADKAVIDLWRGRGASNKSKRT